MKRRVEQMINGKFEYEVPKLILSQERIQIRTSCKKNSQGEIYLGTKENCKIRGYVSSSHRRVVPEVSQFTGTAVKISYGIDVEGLLPADSFQGQLTFLTNVGEYHIPFFVEIETNPVTSTSGEISTLEEFAKLARRDFREAFRLFTSENFQQVLRGSTEKTFSLYQGMTHNPVTYQHLEEFLISAGQKEPVNLTLKKEKASLYQVRESRLESFEIQKSGWGFLRLEVEARGDFLEVTKHMVRDEDFIGSVYQAEYMIHESRLRKGRNFGEILVKGPYQTLVYQVMVSRDKEVQVNISALEKQQRVRLFQTYLELRTRRLDYRQWLSESRKILKTLKDAGCDYPDYQMYEAFLCYQNEEILQAQKILKQYENKSFTKKDLELAGVYLYLCRLTGLLGPKKEIVPKIRSFYNQKADSFLLLWILLQADEEYRISPSKSLFMLEEQYERGCRNPLMYLEAWQLVEKDITLLRRLNGFWIQVFLFAGKQGLLTKELSMRLAYLSGYLKKFSRSLHMALTKAYEQFPEDDTLEAVCRHIMKGEPRKSQFFPWFSLAVERGLRLTRLYEYYMETMDCSYQRPLPRTLKMYFSYNNNLGDQKRAYIYANVIQNKATDPQAYSNYQETIHRFAKSKILEGKINENYAVIYQECLSRPCSGQEVEGLAGQMFTHRLYCDDSKVRKVIVRHSQLKNEEAFPCVDGVAYPRIYTKDAAILFEDDKQRRYASTVEYNLTRMMDEKELALVCRQYEVWEPGFLLYICEQEPVSKENLDVCQRLLESSEFSEAYKIQVRRRLLDYYSQNAQGEDLDDYLKQVDLKKFARVDKTVLMEVMISRGMFAKAYEVMCSYGHEGLSLESMVKLCSRMILEKDMEEEEELVALAAHVFQRGKYDEVILTYLLYYFVGPMDEFFRLWSCACDFQTDTYGVEEKILQFLMLTWDYRREGARVLKNYIQQSGKETLILAYLNFASYGFFIKGYSLDPFLEECLETAYLRKWKMDMVCKLSLFQCLVSIETWTDQQEKIVRELLDMCVHEGYMFRFFERLPEQMRSPYQLDDKAFAECRTAQSAKVTLYYAMDHGLGSTLQYKSEPIKDSYQGVFVKTFTLFYGEVLHYYFVIQLKDEQKKTQERTLTVGHLDMNSQSKYQLLNQMLAARRLGKNQEILSKMKNYLQQEHFVKAMYRIEKE